MKYKFKKFEDLDIIDDYMMNLVASDPVVGQKFSKTLVEALLQKPLGKIRVNVQCVIPGVQQKKRGIRMDVEVLEYNDIESPPVNIYDVEFNKRIMIHSDTIRCFIRCITNVMKCQNWNMKTVCISCISIRPVQKVEMKN